MDVVWNGTIERDAAEQARQYVVTKAQSRSAVSQQVLAHLATVAEATLPEIVVATDRDAHLLNQVIFRLRRLNQITLGERTTISAYGRVCRSYRLAKTS